RREPSTRDRACTLGTYPIRSASALMSARVVALTPGLSLSARETVLAVSPRASATSCSVRRRGPTVFRTMMTLRLLLELEVDPQHRSLATGLLLAPQTEPVAEVVDRDRHDADRLGC